MFKRRLGAAVPARTYWTQCEDLLLKAVPYDVMLIRVFVRFLQSTPDPDSDPFLVLPLGVPFSRALTYP